jgi:hypothetical protein
MVDRAGAMKLLDGKEDGVRFHFLLNRFYRVAHPKNFTPPFPAETPVSRPESVNITSYCQPNIIGPSH